MFLLGSPKTCSTGHCFPQKRLRNWLSGASPNSRNRFTEYGSTKRKIVFAHFSGKHTHVTRPIVFQRVVWSNCVLRGHIEVNWLNGEPFSNPSSAHRDRQPTPMFLSSQNKKHINSNFPNLREADPGGLGACPSTNPVN
jgi:hypothetical protein